MNRFWYGTRPDARSHQGSGLRANNTINPTINPKWKAERGHGGFGPGYRIAERISLAKCCFVLRPLIPVVSGFNLLVLIL